MLDEDGGTLFDNAKLDFVESAGVRKNNELYEVRIKIKKEYIYDLEKISEKNIGKSLMLVLDDELYADPIIRGKIFNGEFLMDAIETEEGAHIVAARFPELPDSTKCFYRIDIISAGCFLQVLFGKNCRSFWTLLHVHFGQCCSGVWPPSTDDQIPLQTLVTYSNSSGCSVLYSA